MLPQRGAYELAKRFLRALTSQIGIQIVVVAYVLIGAYVMSVIEQPADIKWQEARHNRAVEINNERGELIRRVIAVLKNNASGEEMIHALLQEYQNNISEAITKLKYNGTVVRVLPERWGMSSATLYTLSLLAAIGYGHVYPVTMTGQAVTIVYCLVGIPLFLMFLASLGRVLAKYTRKSYDRGCCYFYRRHRLRTWQEYNVEVPTKTNKKESTTQKDKAIRKETKLSKESSADSLRSTKSAGPLLAIVKQARAQLSNQVKPDVTDRPESALSVNVTDYDDQPSTSKYTPPEIVVSSTTSDSPEKMDIEDDVDAPLLNAEDYPEEHEVPVLLAIAVIFSYLLIGTAMFSAWEGWTFMQAFYFSFITLSTIGLGDLVPNWTTGQGSTLGKVKLVISAFYIVFGLSVLSMAFNLMIESVIAKAHNLRRWVRGKRAKSGRVQRHWGKLGSAMVQ